MQLCGRYTVRRSKCSEHFAASRGDFTARRRLFSAKAQKSVCVHGIPYANRARSRSCKNKLCGIKAENEKSHGQWPIRISSSCKGAGACHGLRRESKLADYAGALAAPGAGPPRSWAASANIMQKCKSVVLPPHRRTPRIAAADARGDAGKLGNPHWKVLAGPWKPIGGAGALFGHGACRWSVRKPYLFDIQVGCLAADTGLCRDRRPPHNVVALQRDGQVLVSALMRSSRLHRRAGPAL